MIIKTMQYKYMSAFSFTPIRKSIKFPVIIGINKVQIPEIKIIKKSNNTLTLYIKKYF